MSIESEKIYLAKLLLATESLENIDSVKEIFKKNKTADFWDKLSLEQKEEVERAFVEIQNGEISEYESFMKKMR